MERIEFSGDEGMDDMGTNESKTCGSGGRVVVANESGMTKAIEVGSVSISVVSSKSTSKSGRLEMVS